MTRASKSLGIPLETFSKVIESIYDCALDPNHWQHTVGMIADLCQSECCALGIIEYPTGHTELRFQVGYNDYWRRLQEETYGAINPTVAPFQLLPVGRVVTSDMVIDDRELLESRFYQEFLKPRGIRYALGFKVLQTERRLGLLAAERLESQGSYGDAEIRLFSLLAPHICRSVAISDAFNLKAVHADTLEATLDALASGVYLTDREGRVVYMNRIAEHQVKTSNALRIVNNRLAAVDYAASAALAKAITEAAIDEAEPPTGGITIALPAGEDAGLVATVLPLKSGERQNIGGSFAATAAIFVQDPVVAPPLPGEAFAKLYGLTGSELRVLLAMAPGLSVKEAAEVLGMGETTAKTHLQHIYAKTGTSKQTELMHLFMSSAPPVSETSSTSTEIAK